MTQEALKLALEALKEAHYKMEHYQDEEKREQAITAIKEALAQPEHNFCPRCGKRCKSAEDIHTCTPPQGRTLTDEEIDHYLQWMQDVEDDKLKDKNT